MKLEKFKAEMIAAHEAGIFNKGENEIHTVILKLVSVADAAQSLIDNFTCPMDEDGSLLYAKLDAALKGLEQE